MFLVAGWVMPELSTAQRSQFPPHIFGMACLCHNNKVRTRNYSFCSLRASPCTSPSSSPAAGWSKVEPNIMDGSVKKNGIMVVMNSTKTVLYAEFYTPVLFLFNIFVQFYLTMLIMICEHVINFCKLRLLSGSLPFQFRAFRMVCDVTDRQVDTHPQHLSIIMAPVSARGTTAAAILCLR